MVAMNAGAGNTHCPFRFLPICGYTICMIAYSKREGLLLFIGDVFLLVASLWLTLFVRYGDAPTEEAFFAHLLPFSFLFVAWIAVFYIFDLYGKHTLFLKRRLPGLLFRAQVANALLAALFFYAFPIFNIAPKTILFLSVFISFLLILFWRMRIVPNFGFRRRERAILIAEGMEKEMLLREVRGHRRYAFTFIASLDLGKISGIHFEEDILKRVFEDRVTVIALDFQSEKIEAILPRLYNLLFSNVRFIDVNDIFEDIFDRVPLSSLEHSWVLKNMSRSSRMAYDALKRAMDILISLPLSAVSILISPFVVLAIKLDDGGAIFTKQERVGQGNSIIPIYKIRTMSVISASGEAPPQAVTRAGSFFRKTRIDELPQLWNVLKGDLSLIGPRQEFPHLAKLYEERIPYYNLRHLIKPGLSGWAQVRMETAPKFQAAYDETREKLSYDLYYLKHRSFWLDMRIALLTVKTLLSRSGV